jgi:hypothetical protein
MTVRVLAYHSHNISGNTYATNDHVALASDLETLYQLRARIVSLEEIAYMVRDRTAPDGELVVGLSFDDGPVFDFEDFVHPIFGPQRAFVNSSSEHGMIAAFGVGVGAITKETSVWNIPRLVCGEHWRRPSELRELMQFR